MILLLHRSQQRRSEQMKSANSIWNSRTSDQQKAILKYQDKPKVVYIDGSDCETVVTRMTANRLWAFDLKTGKDVPCINRKDSAIDWEATKANYDYLSLF
jgi:hypothetical protein